MTDDIGFGAVAPRGSLIKPGAARRAGLFFGTVLTTGLVGSVAATQFVAWRLDYHPALGRPLVGSLYAPWSWWTWLHAPWASAVPQTFVMLKLGGLAVLALAGLGAIAFATRAQRPKVQLGVHGTSRFANDERELRAAGLLPKRDSDFWPGVYVGVWRRKNGSLAYLRHRGAEHVMVFAPTRSGKGVSCVIPTLLSWPESTIVYDEKGELWEFTSGWRGDPKGGNNRVLRWEPGSLTNTVSWNPLSEIRLSTLYEFRDASKIAEMIADPEGKGLEGHWDPSAAALLSGVILYAAHLRHRRGRQATLSDVELLLADPSSPPERLYRDMVQNQFGPDGVRNRQIAQEGQKQISRSGKGSKEGDSVLSTAQRMMRLFSDPVVAQATSRSDFQLLDLMNGERPTTLYVVTKSDDKLTLRPLVRMFFAMASNKLTSIDMKKDKKGSPVSPHAYRLLMLIDEFAGLGRLETVEDAMGRAAGYGIKYLLLAQDRAQVLKAYGPHESITSHCHVTVVFAPTNLETKEWTSKHLGASTVAVEAVSESGSRGSAMRNITRTVHMVNRPLLTPEEVGRLRAPEKDGDKIVRPGQVIVRVAGHHPILCEQGLYFADQVFARRVTFDPIMMPSLEPVAEKVPPLVNPMQGGRPEATGDSRLVENTRSEAQEAGPDGVVVTQVRDADAQRARAVAARLFVEAGAE